MSGMYPMGQLMYGGQGGGQGGEAMGNMYYHAAQMGGGAAEPVPQSQARPTGTPFRLSVLAGKSKEVGGFMQVSHATSA